MRGLAGGQNVSRHEAFRKHSPDMARSKKGKKKDVDSAEDKTRCQEDTEDQFVEDAAPSDAHLTWLGASTA